MLKMEGIIWSTDYFDYFKVQTKMLRFKKLFTFQSVYAQKQIFVNLRMANRKKATPLGFEPVPD